MSWFAEKREMAREIVTLLYHNKMIRTYYRDKPQGWTLVSGLYSPVYIQLRPLASYPDVFRKMCSALARMLQEEAPDIGKVIGIAMAGVPLAAGLSLVAEIPAGFTRKMEGVKSPEALRMAIEKYGEHAMLEGELSSGDTVALVDDLVTRFDSKLVALEQVAYEVRRRGLTNVECKTVLVGLDREQGGMEAAEEAGVRLLSLIPFKSIGMPLLKNVMDPGEWETISHYLHEPEYFQNPEARRKLERSALGH